MGKYSELTLRDIRRHKKEGLSAAESGRVLGLRKGQVMGLRHRLGLTDPMVDRKVITAKKLGAARIGEKKPARRVAEVAKGPLGIKLLDLRSGHCRWPTSGESDDTLFCGASQDDGSSYCASHRARAKGKKGEIDETSAKHRGAKKNRPNFAFPRSSTGSGKAA